MEVEMEHGPCIDSEVCRAWWWAAVRLRERVERPAGTTIAVDQRVERRVYAECRTQNPEIQKVRTARQKISRACNWPQRRRI